MAALNEKQARFVEEYLIDLNAKQAAIRAGYSAATAEVQGSRLLRHAEVRAAIDAGQHQRAEKTGITAERVLEELWAIATADPNDLIEYRRGCCRYCHGDGFRYQETPRERAERRKQYDADWEKAQARPAEAAAFRDFDEQGGIGFDARKPPHPECPECFGEGEERVFAKDTRKVSPAARKLYAGVKVTKEGLEIKMHDKAAALAKIGQHLGMFKEQVELRATVSHEDALRALED